METTTNQIRGLRLFAILAFTIVTVLYLSQELCLAQWATRYDSNGNDEGAILAVDSSGNIYVAASCCRTFSSNPHFKDIATIKYDPSGNPSTTWPDAGSGDGVRIYSGPGNQNDIPTAIAIDSFGFVHVSGVSANTGGNLDFVTLKYDADGNLLWVQRYSAPGIVHLGSRLALDESGNVYVAGSSEVSNEIMDYLIIKYDQNGNLSEDWPDVGSGQGVRKYRKAHAYVFSGRDIPETIQLDSEGNVYVIGTDCHTIRYDSNGSSEGWPEPEEMLTQNLINNAICWSMVLDSNGRIHATGVELNRGVVAFKWEADGSPSSTWADNGDGVGVRTFEEGSGRGGLTVDSMGNLYLTGETDGHHIVVLKYDSNGHLSSTWADQGYGVGVRRNAEAITFYGAPIVAIDNSGNLFVIGEGVGLYSSHDYLILKYDHEGNPSPSWPDVGFGVGVRRYNGPSNFLDIPTSFVLDTEGNAYVTGTSLGPSDDIATLKITANGNTDADGDTVLDSADNCPLLDTLERTDSDGDGRGDPCDNCENNPNFDQADTDSDRTGDVCDEDDDNDGLVDLLDNCSTATNPLQDNYDSDSNGDACDPDDDNDSILDVSDNCPFTNSTNQSDSDGDGFGDVCDVLLGRVPIDIKPYSVIVNSTTNRIYIRGNNDAGHFLKVLDGFTNSVIADIDTQTGSDALVPALNPVTNLVYLLGQTPSESNQVTVIDTPTNIH